MSKIFVFSVQFLYENSNQVSLDNFDYKYSDWVNSKVNNNILSNNLESEINDYYNGVGYTSSSLYGSFPRGPGGGGLSASSYVYGSRFNIEDEFNSKKIEFEFIELDSNQITKISNDLKYIITQAFNNSNSNISIIYLSPETGDKLQSTDVNGKNYNFPNKPIFELKTDERSDSINTHIGDANNAGGWVLKYLIKSIEPGKNKFITDNTVSDKAKEEPLQTQTTTSIGDKSYLFNVEEIDLLKSLDLGNFKLIGEGLIKDDFIFQDELSFLDDEYTELEFNGIEEDPSLVFYKDTESLNNVEEDKSLGGTEILIFNGRTFIEPSKAIYYSTTYRLYLDHKKLPIPKLTKNELIKTKLKVEGGLTGNPKDSAASKGYCPTKKDGKSYHTNKGITYAVWKKTFGSNNDDRFLNMNETDWIRIFDDGFWNKNATSKYESVNCLLTSFAWGGNKDATVYNTKLLLGITNLDAVSEGMVVAALLSVRAQFFINISQPKMKNNNFRNGWLNAINEFIKATYFITVV